MHERIAVDLRRGREQETRAPLGSELERVERSDRTDLQRLEGMAPVVDGARRAGEMEDGVERSVDREALGDICLDEPEAGAIAKVDDVIRRAREEPVHAEDGRAIVQQP